MQSDVAQQQWTTRKAMMVDEIDQKVVQIPGTLGDVEDGIVGLARSATRERAVQRARAVESHAREGATRKRHPDHLERLRDVCLKHRIVDVADDAEARARSGSGSRPSRVWASGRAPSLPPPRSRPASSPHPPPDRA